MSQRREPGPAGTSRAAAGRGRRLAGWAAVALVAYALLLGAMWAGQERLLFRPDPLPQDHVYRLDPAVHEGWLEVEGARLNTLHLRLPAPDGVVLFLHGNGGNLESWFVNPAYYREANLDLFMIDYRGYGKSSGRITSQQQLMEDVRSAWRHLQAQYPQGVKIVHGRSLGSGLAALLAAEVQPDLTVLVSPYFSLRQLASELYPWVPMALLRYPVRTDLALPDIRSPVWMVHGARDTLIPVDHARRLQRLAPGARLLVVDQAGHGDIQHTPQYRQGLMQAMREAVAARQRATRPRETPPAPAAPAAVAPPAPYSRPSSGPA